MGLKFKWFRAQLRLDSPKTKSGAVEGIVFRQQPGEYQIYKVISEFSSSVPNLTTIQNGNSQPKKNIVKPIRSDIKPILIQTRSTNNINEQQQQLINHTERLRKEIIKRHDSIPRTKQIETNQVQQQPPPSPPQPEIVPQVQVRQKIQTQISETPPTPLRRGIEFKSEEDEPNWKIKIVNEKPKSPINTSSSTPFPFPPPLPTTPAINNNNNDDYDNDDEDIDDSMYSIQAASIFFGAPPKPPHRNEMKNISRHNSEGESTEA